MYSLALGKNDMHAEKSVEGASVDGATSKGVREGSMVFNHIFLPLGEMCETELFDPGKKKRI
jgi:hypothetical protein